MISIDNAYYNMQQIINEDAHILAQTDLPWEKLNDKTVLISGANGYIPAYFVHVFMAHNDIYESGIKVIALCRNKERAIERFNKYTHRDDFLLHIQDVCDPIQIEDDIHYFIHAASPAGINARNIEPVSTFNANILGCLNMLKLSTKKNTERFLFVSSVDVYGILSPPRRFVETDSSALDCMNPRNAYAVSKLAAENLCACFLAQHGVPIVVVRPFQIMGGGIALDDGRLHIDFISQMLSSDKIMLKSDGQAKRTFMYITDAVMGMLTAMLNGSPGEAYNIVDENGEASVLELAQLMASLVSRKKIEVGFDYEKRNAIEVTSAPSVTTGDSGKLRELGWQAKLSLKDSASRMMRYYGLL